MSSTAQKAQSTYSISDSERSFVNIPDEQFAEMRTTSPFDESISAAYAELQEILRSKSVVESRLKDLFAQRRAHALEELEQARRRLEFVDDEEKRMRQCFAGECFKEDTVCITRFIRAILLNIYFDVS
jgi:hypothetical protein